MKWLTFFLGLLSLPLFGQEVVDLYIVEGGVGNGNFTMSYFTFSRTDQFDSSNAILRFTPGTEVTFRVTNKVDFTCGFKIQDYGETVLIPADSTRELTVTLDQEGTFFYEDPTNDHRALGLGGMLVVSDFNGPEYYGVFAEHDQEWVVPISEGGSYDRREYHPEAFTINGKGFPDTMRDSLAFIMGGVGDTIRIHMTNAGMMYHFPHFHGYHVKIIEATYHKRYIGWMKDSYGMAPGESITVELVPDKPGMFPMHNHNLVTTTIGGNYPGGMMMHMHIHE